MMEQEDNGNGFKLSMTQWRGQITQKVDDTQRDVGELKCDIKEGFEKLYTRLEEYNKLFSQSMEQVKKEHQETITCLKDSTNKELLGIKLDITRHFTKWGVIAAIGLFLITTLLSGTIKVLLEKFVLGQ